MLRALARWILQNDTPVTQPGRSDQYITCDEFNRELKKFSERLEWELGDWYEKFSTLHARLTKRIDRATRMADEPKGKSTQEPDGVEEPMSPLPSVLLFRRPGSV